MIGKLDIVLITKMKLIETDLSLCVNMYHNIISILHLLIIIVIMSILMTSVNLSLTSWRPLLPALQHVGFDNNPLHIDC